MNEPPEVIEVLRQWVRKAEAPRTRDLKALAAQIPGEQGFSLRIEEIVELNPYARWMFAMRTIGVSRNWPMRNEHSRWQRRSAWLFVSECRVR